MPTERDWVQIKMHCITIEDLVPEDHFLRKLESAVDFSFIYAKVRELYYPGNGRPGIDPVVSPAKPQPEQSGSADKRQSLRNPALIRQRVVS